MTIKRITLTDLESNRVILRPEVTYVTSGSDVTGSMPLISNPSNRVKVNYSEGSGGNNVDISQILTNIKIDLTSSDNSKLEAAQNELSLYLDEYSVNADLPSKNSKEFQIKIENIPGIQYFEASSNLPRSGSLSTLVNSVIERASEIDPNMSYGFTNYNCLGFMSGGNTSSKTALVYKDDSGTGDFRSFCVSMFVKPPKVTNDTFNPATVFHIDNLISVSIVSGSKIDKNENINSFEIVSQLSGSNENRVNEFVYSTSSIADNNAVYSDFSKNVAYTSTDVLEKDNWYNIAVSVFENQSGEIEQKIFVDQLEITGSVSSFSAPFNRGYANSNGDENSEIVIGNKLDISEEYSEVFIDAYKDYEKYTNLGPENGIGSLVFESPFFGEVHEIIFSTSQNTNFPIQSFFSRNLSTLSPDLSRNNFNIDFYLPVMFSAGRIQKMRTAIKKLDGIGIFASRDLKFAPHENFILSNDLRFPEVNISSFLGAYSFNILAGDVRDINRVYPRCIGMESIDDIANDEKYAQGVLDNTSHNAASELSSFFTRNNLIRPADNTGFTPDYENYKRILNKTRFPDNLNQSHPGFETYFLSSSLENEDVSHVLMKNYITGSNFRNSMSTSMVDLDTYGGTSNLNRTIFFDNNLALDRTSSLVMSLKDETGFNHSNLVSVIDIPQMFYSKKIHPGTFEIIDHDLTGSSGMLTYNIKDNGLGTLYRNDSAAPDKRSKCGLIFYELGVAILTHPAYCLFGKNHYTVKFRGEKDLNVLNVNAHIGKYEFNESVNPSYNSLGKAGSESNNEEVVMITNIDYLDENLNVVMRSNLSHPVSKREFDEILFRSRIDF